MSKNVVYVKKSGISKFELKCLVEVPFIEVRKKRKSIVLEFPLTPHGVEDSYKNLVGVE